MPGLLLEELQIDRIEIASALVSQGEFDGAKKILDWANEHGCEDRIEILGFVDGRSFFKLDQGSRREGDQPAM